MKTIQNITNYAVSHAHELLELDVNPVLVRPAGAGAVAVDALIHLGSIRSSPKSGAGFYLRMAKWSWFSLNRGCTNAWSGRSMSKFFVLTRKIIGPRSTINLLLPSNNLQIWLTPYIRLVLRVHRKEL